MTVFEYSRGHTQKYASHNVLMCARAKLVPTAGRYVSRRQVPRPSGRPSSRSERRGAALEQAAKVTLSAPQGAEFRHRPASSSRPMHVSGVRAIRSHEAPLHRSYPRTGTEAGHHFRSHTPRPTSREEKAHVAPALCRARDVEISGRIRPTDEPTGPHSPL